MGVGYPSGVGAGVVCNFASFAASDVGDSDVAVEDALDESPERSRYSVTRKYVDGEDE
jgi:hypothetical protein